MQSTDHAANDAQGIRFIVCFSNRIIFFSIFVALADGFVDGLNAFRFNQDGLLILTFIFFRYLKYTSHYQL